jgi:hypothetical protein
MPGILVAGYAGYVYINLTPDDMHYFSAYHTPDVLLNHHFRIFKNEPYGSHCEQYHRVSFRDGRMTEQTYNIVSINGSTFATL